jgi:AcrR family transcriptional regulator
MAANDRSSYDPAMTVQRPASGGKTVDPAVVDGDVLTTRERIIRAAARLFLEHGYDGTAVSRIAQDCGLTTAALYWHFPSKEALYYAFLNQSYRAFVDDLEASITGDEPVDRLRSFVEAFVKLQLRDPEISMKYGYNQLRAGLSEENRSKVAELQQRLIDGLRTILRAGQDDGSFEIEDITVTAFAITTACEYVFVWFKPTGRKTAAEVAELYAEMMVAMVRVAQPAIPRSG